LLADAPLTGGYHPHHAWPAGLGSSPGRRLAGPSRAGRSPAGAGWTARPARCPLRPVARTARRRLRTQRWASRAGTAARQPGPAVGRRPAARHPVEPRCWPSSGGSTQPADVAICTFDGPARSLDSRPRTVEFLHIDGGQSAGH